MPFPYLSLSATSGEYTARVSGRINGVRRRYRAELYTWPVVYKALFGLGTVCKNMVFEPTTETPN